MAADSEETTEVDAKVVEEARCYEIARSGVSTSEEFARLMSALMSDVILNRVTPSVANAAVNAGGKLLKIVELVHRHGTAGKRGKVLHLVQPPRENGVSADEGGGKLPGVVRRLYAEMDKLSPSEFEALRQILSEKASA